jgi:hypothetical protein
VIDYTRLTRIIQESSPTQELELNHTCKSP